MVAGRGQALENARRHEDAVTRTAATEELLRAVAHDLNTPTSVIHLVASTLDAPPAESRARRVSALVRAADRLGSLVHQLTDLARLDAGRLRLVRDFHDPLLVIRETLELHEPAAGGQEVTLVLDAPERVPPVSMDRERIERVLSNLLENALRVAPPGSRVTVGARLGPEALRVEVVDHGPGLTPEQLRRVLDRTPQPGPIAWSGVAGLGLCIARGIIEAHGGRLALESAPGAPTVAWFELPLQPP